MSAHLGLFLLHRCEDGLSLHPPSLIRTPTRLSYDGLANLDLQMSP